MRLSGLALATILLFSSVAVAQHSSGGGGSSSGSSGGGGSSSSGGSHGGYSGGGSSSGASATHSTSSGSSASHPSHQSSGSSAAAAIREPGSARVPSQPEKRTFFSFLHHPLKKAEPKTEADLRHRICAKGPCPVCPAGQAGKNGGCAAPAQAHSCESGEYWNGGGCAGLPNYFAKCSLDPSGDLTAAGRDIVAANSNMEAACSQDPAGHECSEQNALYQRAVDSYKQRQASHARAYEECRRGRPLSSLSGLYAVPLLP
jgi:hypothetical protein